MILTSVNVCVGAIFRTTQYRIPTRLSTKRKNVERVSVVEEAEDDEEGETPIRDCQEEIKEKEEKEKELKNEKQKDKVVDDEMRRGKNEAKQCCFIYC